ncbi:AIR synthase-related protein, partial [Acidithiobacillus caldus]
VRAGAHRHLQIEGENLLDLLLRPTRIYVRSVQALRREVPVHALAHITGGGLDENLPRSLPAGLAAVIDPKAWPWPAIFHWLQEQGQVELHEMRRVFNLGIGMVAIVPWAERERALACLAAAGEPAWVIGRLQERGESAGVVYLD